MTLFILTETSAGYALFKAKDKKLLKRDDLVSQTATAAGTSEVLKLKSFKKYENAAVALNEVAALVESKVTPFLTSFLDPLKEEKKASLAVADPKLANAIGKIPGLSITPISDSSTGDIFRAIREHLPSLVDELSPSDIKTMNLGLSHSLSRHKLKFSPEKVDTMIIQAVNLLDDIDKELNQYAMRCKEWYGWHFPEMAKIINDNYAYARVVRAMGMRSNATTTDLAEILPEEIETAVKGAAEISMGTEITEEDFQEIYALADNVIDLYEYRQDLSRYLTSRMNAIAPNLTALVGEVVGARLIAHAGSVVNLSKSPASTIQVLGAEKALFRALKTKHDTPKYGLIYHASLIGQATGKNKGKIARMLAAKTALGLRIDTLSDWGAIGAGKEPEPTDEVKVAFASEARSKLERHLSKLEGRPVGRKAAAAVAPADQPGKWSVKEARKYNPDADGLTGDEPAATGNAVAVNGTPKSDKKSKKLVEEVDSEDSEDSDEEMEDAETPAKSKGDGKELSKDDRKAQKKAEKEAKKARKAERAAKRAAKEAKKAAKEAKGDDSSKKRKRDEGEEKTEKKKKKNKE